MHISCDEDPTPIQVWLIPIVFQINAMANRAAGKGYENENNYQNIKFQFFAVENIHVMRSSLQKLVEGELI